MMAEYFALDVVPDHSVLCKKNSSRQWLALWKRFLSFVLESLPRRSVVVATDASGFSGRKRLWWEMDHAVKARENWVRVHSTIEVDEFLVLSYSLNRSNVHDGQMFASVWNKLPKNVSPKRSLANPAYHSEKCLAAARQHGATPLHAIKKNARECERPKTFYQKPVNFAHHWPRRFAALYAKRVHAETVFSMIGALLGHRLRCRSSSGRKNEVRVKLALFNLIQLAMRKEFWS